MSCRCDPARIGQVLNNLIINAIKYSPDGGPVLIDWEFHRWGDPAEDLAYLAEGTKEFDEYIRDEVIPFIHADTQTPGIPIATFGAASSTG